MKKKAKRYAKDPNKRKKNNIGIYILIIFFICIMVISGRKIYYWIKDTASNNKILDEISNKIIIDYTKEECDKDRYSIDFGKLIEQNNDTIGWLKVNGTEIEYPVVRSADNNDYLTHNFNKEYNSAGWIFSDYRNKIDGTDKNIIIYGHNIRDGSMFGTLKNILTEDWYNNEENRRIIFFTESEKNIYEVFSVYKIEKEEYYIQTSFTQDSYKQFLNTIKNRSIKDFNVNITEEDNILTLSTCDNNNKYRVVLHAKKISN